MFCSTRGVVVARQMPNSLDEGIFDSNKCQNGVNRPKNASTNT